MFRTKWIFNLFILFFIGIILPVSLVAKENKIKPGVIITQENYKNYLSDLKELLPISSTFLLYSHGLEQGWVTMPIVETVNYPPPKGVGEATAKYASRCRTGPNNSLEGWVAGVPFPNPKTGLELGWNAYRRRGGGDDYSIPADFYLIGKNGKVERTFRWVLYGKRWLGRVDNPPFGDMPGNNGVLNLKEALIITKPFDVKGFCMIKVRYEDLDREDENYSFIPAIRRIRRLTGADVTDPLLGSDCIPDDFEVWRQKITPKMTFKMRDKTILAPRACQYGKKPPYESFIKGNCFQIEWEIRPCWELEIMINDPNYLYSKRIMYVDKKDGCCNLWSGEGYDQKGRLFRTLPIVNAIFNFENNRRGCCGFTYYNCLTGHSTLMDMDYNLSGVAVPLEKFTIKSLLRDAR